MKCCEQQGQPPTDIEAEPATCLRQATAELHRQLDQLTPIRALLGPRVAPAELAVVANGLSRCFAWLDPCLARAERTQGLPAGCRPYQPRSAWLSAPLTIEPRPAEALNDGAYWGARYVVEGSTLGSRLILRRLQEVGHLAPESLEYWRNQVDESVYWPEFRRALNDQLRPPAECQAAVDAARRVFARFIDEFDTMERDSSDREGSLCLVT